MKSYNISFSFNIADTSVSYQHTDIVKVQVTELYLTGDLHTGRELR